MNYEYWYKLRDLSIIFAMGGGKFRMRQHFSTPFPFLEVVIISPLHTRTDIFDKLDGSKMHGWKWETTIFIAEHFLLPPQRPQPHSENKLQVLNTQYYNIIKYTLYRIYFPVPISIFILLVASPPLPAPKLFTCKSSIWPRCQTCLMGSHYPDQQVTWSSPQRTVYLMR